MLVLSRQRDESLMIGDDLEVTIVDIRFDIETASPVYEPFEKLIEKPCESSLSENEINELSRLVVSDILFGPDNIEYFAHIRYS